MSDEPSTERDFSFDRELVPGLSPNEEPLPKPIVVIEYRNRGLVRALLPPLLILVAALVIVSYQRQHTVRPLSLAAAAATPVPPGRGRTIMVEPSGVGVTADPIVVRSGPAVVPVPSTGVPTSSGPIPTTVAASVPPLVGPETLFEVAAPAPSPSDPQASPPGSQQGKPLIGAKSKVAVAAVSEPVQPAKPDTESDGAAPAAPPAERVAAGVQAGGEGPQGGPPPAGAEADPTKEQILADIEREAREKNVELRNQGEQRVQLQVQEFVEMRRKVEENRPLFQSDLSRLLNTRGKAAGQDIADLCDQYGRTVPPEVRNTVSKLLKGSAAHLGRREKIKLMRTYGLPEPMILDYLAHDFDHQIHARNGPRDEDEVWVFAARFLISQFPRHSGQTGQEHLQPIAKVTVPAGGPLNRRPPR